jgi:hypothetical protein
LCPSFPAALDYRSRLSVLLVPAPSTLAQSVLPVLSLPLSPVDLGYPLRQLDQLVLPDREPLNRLPLDLSDLSDLSLQLFQVVLAVLCLPAASCTLLLRSDTSLQLLKASA